MITPGPWKVIYCEVSRNQRVHLIIHGNKALASVDKPEDANLISVVHELLMVAEMVVKAGGGAPISLELAEAAEAAIAKAKNGNKQ